MVSLFPRTYLRRIISCARPTLSGFAATQNASFRPQRFPSSRLVSTFSPQFREPSSIAQSLDDPNDVPPASQTETSSKRKSAISQKLPDPDQVPERLREFDLSGKVFVVTGGGQGLGLVLAEALVEAGGRVHCLDRRTEPDSEFLRVSTQVAEKFGGTLNYAQVDVRDADKVESTISSIADRYRRLDGLVAAAGIQRVVPALEYPTDEIMDMLEVNYKGVYLAAVSCARSMIRYSCPGSLVLIGSMSGFIANKGFTSSVYNSSKAAVVQLARSLAMEWGQIITTTVSEPDPDRPGRLRQVERKMPIRVNTLCPGNILTPMVRKNFEDDPELEAIWTRENMMGRMSRPEEYRGAVLFMLSEASSFMTGSALIIDGGYCAW